MICLKFRWSGPEQNWRPLKTKTTPGDHPKPPLSNSTHIYIPIDSSRRQDSKYVISNQFNMCRPKIAFVPASWMRAWYLTRWDHWDQSIFWHVSSKSYASYTLLQQATKKNGSCMTYGLPTDAIDVVKYLYMEACTKVRLPSAEHTESILVKRGTIQGDTFSPLFFFWSIWSHFYSGSIEE